VWALGRGWGPVDAIGFDYGQPHRKELTAAEAVADALGVPFRVMPLDMSGGLLDGGTEGAATVVPGRNAAFLRAARPGARGLVIGCTLEDFDTYPDCRPAFVDEMRDALDLPIWAPVIRQTKAEVWAMVPPEVRALTWSCYRGGTVPCGGCGACQTRALAVECPECRANPTTPTPPGMRCHASSGFGLPHRARVEASCR
jgi:7-cyano-7-deazaguanine synthase